jgi:hypothetical protein
MTSASMQQASSPKLFGPVNSPVLFSMTPLVRRQ